MRLTLFHAGAAKHVLAWTFHQLLLDGRALAVLHRAVSDFHEAICQRRNRSVLKGMAADRSQRVADLPLLTVAEQRQLLADWNDTEADFPGDKCIHELFETQVERMPNAVALVYIKEEVSYRELDNQTNRVARHLRSLGVGPEVPVGIRVQRSTDMNFSLLGILKAGGAYLPLDPAYPNERLLFMLDDLGAPVLLTQKALEGRFRFLYSTNGPRTRTRSSRKSFLTTAVGAEGARKTALAITHEDRYFHLADRFIRLNYEKIERGHTDRFKIIAGRLRCLTTV
jgi:non-ribosomal peptide synthetase component F